MGFVRDDRGACYSTAKTLSTVHRITFGAGNFSVLEARLFGRRSS